MKTKDYMTRSKQFEAVLWRTCQFLEISFRKQEGTTANECREIQGKNNSQIGPERTKGEKP